MWLQKLLFKARHMDYIKKESHKSYDIWKMLTDFLFVLYLDELSFLMMINFQKEIIWELGCLLK